MKIKDLPINIQLRLWGSFFNRCIYSATLPFIALYLTDHINTRMAGLFLISIIFVQFISNIWGGYLVDQFPRKKVLLFEAITLLLMWLTVLNTWIYLFMVTYVFFTIFSAFRRPSLSALVQDSATEENKKLLYRLYIKKSNNLLERIIERSEWNGVYKSNT
ncbi:MFS transporter [Macrococcus animalis]|uniref:MFS transporter n=1 Tax=Macrococcus animalis TaxID=3395467 RepID=UPI0039BE5A61